MVVTIQVEVPKKLNEEQVRLLHDFARASGSEPPKPPEGGGGILGGLFGKKK
jgi:DnaJ-class molecular chaperone